MRDMPDAIFSAALDKKRIKRARAVSKKASFIDLLLTNAIR